MATDFKDKGWYHMMSPEEKYPAYYNEIIWPPGILWPGYGYLSFRAWLKSEYQVYDRSSNPGVQFAAPVNVPIYDSLGVQVAGSKLLKKQEKAGFDFALMPITLLTILWIRDVQTGKLWSTRSKSVKTLTKPLFLSQNCHRCKRRSVSATYRKLYPVEVDDTGTYQGSRKRVAKVNWSTRKTIDGTINAPQFLRRVINRVQSAKLVNMATVNYWYRLTELLDAATNKPIDRFVWQQQHVPQRSILPLLPGKASAVKFPMKCLNFNSAPWPTVYCCKNRQRFDGEEMALPVLTQPHAGYRIDAA